MGVISLQLRLAPLAFLLSSCGAYVPAKHLLKSDLRIETPENSGQSTEGRAEADIVGNIRCEIQNGIYEAALMKHGGQLKVGYLSSSWGTQVTLKLTWDEQSSFAPGVTFLHPLSASSSRSVGIGGTATSHATRVETVTFLYSNADLLQSEQAWVGSADNPSRLPHDCTMRETGTMIHSDLHIGDFIIDKATIAGTGISSTDDPADPPFSAFQEDITFVAAYGGSFTPSLKLVRFSANTSGNLLSGTRTTTGEVIITLGPLARDPDHPGMFLHKLGDPASSQHTAAITGSATATQVSSQSH